MPKSKKATAKTSLSATVTWFKGFTTLGGVTQARESDNRISVAAWIVVFFVGGILTVVSLYSTIQKYLRYGVVINYSVVKT
jgi:hypothetical protein